MSTPPAIANALLRDWDFGAIASPTVGASISAVPDNTSTSNMTQATGAAQPTLEQATVNGKTFWYGSFDAVDDYLGSGALSGTHAALTVIVIATQTAASSTQRAGALAGYGPTNDYQSGAFALSVNPTASTSDWTGITVTAGVDTPVDTNFTFGTAEPFGTWDVVVAAIDGTGTAGYAAVNGAVLGTLAKGSSGNFSINGFFAGARDFSNRPSAFAPVGVARMLVYDGIVSAADRAKIDSWVQDTYGITVSDYVPSGSPASGTATLTLSGTAQAGTTAAGTASLTVSAVSSGSAPAAGAGLFSIVGSASTTSPTSGSGSLGISSTAAGVPQATASSSLNVTGTTSTTSPSSGTASVTVTGSAHSGASEPASATGTLSLAGTAATQASVNAQASVGLAGSGPVHASAAASGSVGATGTGLVATRAAGAAQLQIAAQAQAATILAGLATISLSGSGAALLGSYGNVVITIGGAGPASGTWSRFDLIVDAPIPRVTIGPPIPRLTIGRPIPRLTVGQPA